MKHATAFSLTIEPRASVRRIKHSGVVEKFYIGVGRTTGKHKGTHRSLRRTNSDQNLSEKEGWRKGNRRKEECGKRKK